jgi:phosphotransferase system HPr-like phosphotransfer protein
MMLAAAKGTTILVSAEGDDEDKAMDGMERLFRNKFGEKE